MRRPQPPARPGRSARNRPLAAARLGPAALRTEMKKEERMRELWYNVQGLENIVLFCVIERNRYHNLTIIYFLILYNNLFTIKLHYQNPVDTSFVFIRWSNLYIFQTSIASISSSFVDEGVVLWFNSKCISRLTLSFVL